MDFGSEGIDSMEQSCNLLVASLIGGVVFSVRSREKQGRFSCLIVPLGRRKTRKMEQRKLVNWGGIILGSLVCNTQARKIVSVDHVAKIYVSQLIYT